jgi:hypothetical protein
MKNLSRKGSSNNHECRIFIVYDFVVFYVVFATQASHAPPENGEFAEAPVPSVTGIAATLKWCPLGKCLHCCQCSNVFNRPLCSRCC